MRLSINASTENRKMKGLFLALGALLLLVFIGGAVVHAQNGGDYNLTWWTVDGGGDRLTGGSYVLQGTAGQPDAGALTGGGYQLAGGYWPSGVNDYKLYLPITLKN